MKERPILFSGAMVRALLSGAKTQTRRVVKPQPEAGLNWVGWCLTSTHTADEGKATWARGEGPHLVDTHRVGCPHGQPGDRLWVRETFYAWGRWETRYSAKKRRDEWHFEDLTLESGKSYSYSADGDGPMFERGKRNAGVLPGWWKRPAIFMPRWASRITLEITSVRVERLQDISEADAQAEGVTDTNALILDRAGNTQGGPIAEYAVLWDSINGPGSWDTNPWVWVVSFKRLP